MAAAEETLAKLPVSKERDGDLDDLTAGLLGLKTVDVPRTVTCEKKLFCCENGCVDYKNKWIPGLNANYFKDFRDWQKGITLETLSSSPFAIQAVKKVNMGPVLSTEWYVREGSGFTLDKTNNKTRTFKRSNDFENYVCKTHKFFFELNLYVVGAEAVSRHHESTRSGRTFARDSSIDQETGTCTKGPHWTHPTTK